MARRALGTGFQDRKLLTESSVGPDLWSKLLPLIPKDVATAFVGGPFFDPALALVRRLQRDLQPKWLVIGIDPESVEIDPVEAAKIEDVEWVNIAGVPDIPQRREGRVAVPAREGVLVRRQAGGVARHGKREPERCGLLRAA